MRKIKRFYRDVSVGEREGGFAVLLDGKPLKSPSRSAFSLPSKILAEAVADEWREQAEDIDPDSMALLKLANTAIERIPAARGEVVAQVLGYGRSDLLCYRAEAPQSLVARQTEAWDPLLAWLAQRHGARLEPVAGIVFRDQDPQALAALERAVAGLDDFTLTGLAAAASLLGSLTLALALLDGRIDAAEAFAHATLDEAFQAEHWGEDEEARARLAAHAAELATVERFLRLVGAPR